MKTRTGWTHESIERVERGQSDLCTDETRKICASVGDGDKICFRVSPPWKELLKAFKRCRLVTVEIRVRGGGP